MASRKQSSKTTKPKGFNYFKFIGYLMTEHPLVCSRHEFFSFQIVSWIIFFVVIIIGNALGSSVDLTSIEWVAILIAVIYVVMSFLAMVGRLHDTGRSAAWLLLSLIPYIGGLIVLIFMFQPNDSALADDEDNRYRKAELANQDKLGDRVQKLIDEGQVSFFTEPTKPVVIDYSSIADKVDDIAQLLDNEITETEETISSHTLKAINALLYQYATRLMGDEIDQKFDSNNRSKEYSKMTKVFAKKFSLPEETIITGLSGATSSELRQKLLSTLEYQYSINLYTRQVAYVVLGEQD